MICQLICIFVYIVHFMSVFSSYLSSLLGAYILFLFDISPVYSLFFFLWILLLLLLFFLDLFFFLVLGVWRCWRFHGGSAYPISAWKNQDDAVGVDCWNSAISFPPFCIGVFVVIGWSDVTLDIYI